MGSHLLYRCSHHHCPFGLILHTYSLKAEGCTATIEAIPTEKAPRSVAGGLSAGMGKVIGGQVPFLASRRHGGVGAVALPLGSLIHKHDSEANEDEDMSLQKIPVYKKM